MGPQNRHPLQQLVRSLADPLEIGGNDFGGGNGSDTGYFVNGLILVPDDKCRAAKQENQECKN